MEELQTTMTESKRAPENTTAKKPVNVTNATRTLTAILPNGGKEIG
jgi:hypothetical protein